MYALSLEKLRERKSQVQQGKNCLFQMSYLVNSGRNVQLEITQLKYALMRTADGITHRQTDGWSGAMMQVKRINECSLTEKALKSLK
jgi:hypothetical protein